MDPLGSKLLADLLHGRHPGDGQVAVLEDHPRPILQRCRDQLGGNGTLRRREGGNCHPLQQEGGGGGGGGEGTLLPIAAVMVMTADIQERVS